MKKYLDRMMTSDLRTEPPMPSATKPTHCVVEIEHSCVHTLGDGRTQQFAAGQRYVVPTDVAEYLTKKPEHVDKKAPPPEPFAKYIEDIAEKAPETPAATAPPGA